MRGMVARAVTDKLGGARPGPLRAGVAAAAVGGAVAVAAYKLLRRE